jgi:hypothetical protein
MAFEMVEGMQRKFSNLKKIVSIGFEKKCEFFF